VVDEIERGDLDTERTRTLLASYIQPLLDQGADTLVLGCTHYPFVAPAIRAIAGPDVTLVDPAAAVARELRRRLAEAALLAPAELTGSVDFRTTGSPEQLARMLRVLGIEQGPVSAL
jgi:glutamate racemase